MRDLVNLFIAGLDREANFALIALGLTLVFGTLGVVNFAHGALFLLGALVLLGTRYFFETQFITDTSAAPIKDFLGNEVFPQVSLGEYLLGLERSLGSIKIPRLSLFSSQLSLWLWLPGGLNAASSDFFTVAHTPNKSW